jgi:hypothetical protein
VLGREFGDALAPLGRERAAAGVLEGRDRVQERGRVAVAERGLDDIRLEAFVVHLDCLDGRAERAQDFQRPVVCRALDQHAAAWGEELRE